MWPKWGTKWGIEWGILRRIRAAKSGSGSELRSL